MNTDIYHCVFTHATDGWNASGGRFPPVERDAAQILPAEALEELKSFLGKMMPESSAAAWSMRRFAGGTERFACVIASYNGFEDAAGRGGVLNHARVVKLERESLWFDPFPLVAMAEELDIELIRKREPIDRLQAYLTRIADEDVVVVRSLSRHDLKTLPPQLVRDVLTGTLAAIADTRGRRRVLAPRGRLAEIARAWAALPVGLQRLSTWGYTANDGIPVQLNWTLDPEDVNVEEASRSVVDCVAKYVTILDSTYDVRQIVSDEGMDLAAFSQFVQRASATVAATLPEKIEMPKKSSKAEPRPRAQTEVDGETVVDLNRQYDRMFASLREYVDLRIDALEAGRAAKPAPRSAESATATWRDRIAIPAAILVSVVVTVVVLELFGMLRLRERFRANPSETATTTQQEPAPIYTPSANETVEDLPQASPRLQRFIADAATTGRWKEAFLAFSEGEPETVARMIEETINDPTTGRVTRTTLADFRDRIRGTGKKLGAGDREALRKYLLQFVARKEGSAGEQIVIDESLKDLTPVVVRSVKARTNAGSATDNPEDFDLQSEAILRWLEKNPS
ncbi:MAG TPA: hypothetical protein VGQ76_06050 [Thermoanaerobaculia bacterium]|jgi:hypothetical protein|nr:hypothetical protein [Thermoanaerobaculia bacterium]